MTDLIPTTAFGTTTPRVVTHGPLTLAEDVTTALASVSLRKGGAVPALLGLTLPAPGQWVGGDGASAIWMGSEQWMILADNRADGDFAADIAAASPGCSVTEQTDGWVILDIQSTDGAEPILTLLEKLVNLDPAALAPGRATRTRIEHLGVVVQRMAHDRLRILGMRSAAESLWHHLELTMTRMAPGS